MEPVEEILLPCRVKWLVFIQKTPFRSCLAEDVLQDGLLMAIQSAGEPLDGQRL